MAREGASARGPPKGPALKRAGFDVIPVYRDWREFPYGKSGAVLNVKWAGNEGNGAVSASTLVNGLVPVQFPPWEVVACYIGASDDASRGLDQWWKPLQDIPYRTSEAKEV